MSTDGMSTDELRDVHRGGVAPGEPRSVLSRPLVWAIRGYQATLSPVLGPVCRYYPSCSAYGVTALERHGVLRGSWLTGRRLLRCNPFARGGVDHVPPACPGTRARTQAAGAPHTAAPSTPVSPAHHRD